MANNYRCGRKIRSVGDFEKSDATMFYVSYGKTMLRHRGWLESQQYHQLKILINRGMRIAVKVDDNGKDAKGGD